MNAFAQYLVFLSFVSTVGMNARSSPISSIDGLYAPPQRCTKVIDRQVPPSIFSPNRWARMLLLLLSEQCRRRRLMPAACQKDAPTETIESTAKVQRFFVPATFHRLI
jgi:hypothetical protein